MVKEQYDLKEKHSKEIEVKNTKIKRLKFKMDRMVDMTIQLMRCQPPARVYALYLQEQYLSF